MQGWQSYLQKQFQKLDARLTAQLDRDALKDQANLKSKLLPDAEAMGKILRYETTIHRQLHSDLEQLERLQRRRKGDFVPPPLKVRIEMT